MSENSRGILIREMKPDERKLMEEFLCLAIYQPAGQKPLPSSVVQDPVFRNYVVDFGKANDFCLVAEQKGQVVGMVWTRILAGQPKGYGNIDDKTPEFALAVAEDYRNQGLETKLMRKMLWLLKERGYHSASLAVQKENPALYLYLAVGFYIARIRESEYIMLHDLDIIK